MDILNYQVICRKKIRAVERSGYRKECVGKVQLPLPKKEASLIKAWCALDFSES